MAPSRLRPPPCELKDLLRIDVVLVSHSHYDVCYICLVHLFLLSYGHIIPPLTKISLSLSFEFTKQILSSMFFTNQICLL